MGSRQIFGIVLLVVGLVLFMTGWNASGSVNEKLTETLTGRYTRETTLYLIGGGGAAVAGLLLLLLLLGRSRR